MNVDFLCRVSGYSSTMVPKAIASIDTVDTLLRYRTIIDIDLCRTRVSIPVLRQAPRPGQVRDKRDTDCDSLQRAALSHGMNSQELGTSAVQRRDRVHAGEFTPATPPAVTPT